MTLNTNSNNISRNKTQEFFVNLAQINFASHTLLSAKGMASGTRPRYGNTSGGTMLEGTKSVTTAQIHKMVEGSLLVIYQVAPSEVF